MARGEMLTYKFDTGTPVVGAWTVVDELVFEKKTEIIGCFCSLINTGTANGAWALSKSGTVMPSVVKQNDVLFYWESQQGEFTQSLKLLPEDARFHFDKNDRIYAWFEKADGAISHAILYYKEV